jgi:hypothetical protein
MAEGDRPVLGAVGGKLPLWFDRSNVRKQPVERLSVPQSIGKDIR